jgi:hypothetical protein
MCTAGELIKASTQKMPKHLILDDSKVSQFSIVINSGMEIQSDSILSHEDSNFVYINFDMDAVTSGHTLTVFSSYKLSDLWLDMTFQSS